MENKLPIDNSVIESFGFSHFDDFGQRAALFSLYVMLVQVCGVDDDELRQAWKENRLHDFIIFRCSQVSSENIKHHLAWFRRQKPVFMHPEAKTGIESRWFEPLLHLLEPEDKKKPIEQLEPTAKRHAFIFYSQATRRWSPQPEEPTWISLGFCTSRNRGEEGRIGSVYHSLISKCTFTEFWVAMQTSGLTALFKKYGFKEQIKRFRNFETLIEQVGYRQQSVWHLKQFIQSNKTAIPRAVLVDYGFKNCRYPMERQLLRDCYAEFFERGQDEMALHNACIQGNLLTFLCQTSGDFRVPSELLRNCYPIDDEYAGYVYKNVLMCPESARAAVADKEKDGYFILTIPDDADENMQALIYDKAAHMSSVVKVSYDRDKGLKSMAVMEDQIG
jgi:hypothetical protein